MPVLITGMHRSGTSMIARLLNLCGLYLGEPNEMLPAQPDNPRGFWEHWCFQQIDKSIINSFGRDDVKTGHLPLLMTEDWEKDTRLDTTYLWARRLVHSMNHSADNWGFKDPRASILLPFWYQMIPDLKVIICLRHPLDVAASLMKRDDIDEEECLDIWYAYNRMLLDTAKDYIMTSYDRYFVVAKHSHAWNPAQWLEIRRLCRFSGLGEGPVSPDSFAADEIKPNLRHHTSGGELPDKVQKLYDKLLEETG